MTHRSVTDGLTVLPPHWHRPPRTNQSAFAHFISNLVLTAVKQWTQDQRSGVHFNGATMSERQRFSKQRLEQLKMEAELSLSIYYPAYQNGLQNQNQRKTVGDSPVPGRMRQYSVNK